MSESTKNLIQQFTQVFKALPAGKRMSFALILAIVVGGFAALIFWANSPDYHVLFTNLDATDAAQITEKLKEQRIPFQLKEGGSAILVPDDMVYQLRLELAGEGIPKGQNVGFEVFDNMPFGTTEFVQKLKYQQALQGELARTIMQFDAVAEARIHVVSAGESLFAVPEKPATASVVLRLHPGRRLDRQQLQGVINLVACAVEGLRPENVSVVDMAGGLLSGGYEDDSVGTLSRAQFEYQRKLERALETRIQTMLEPVVGQNKVVARVSAEVDFGQISIVEESFDPDSSVVRSEQRQKESSGGGDRPAGSPDLKYELYQGAGGAGGGAAERFEKESSTINYEINRVNKQITNSVGDVKRLSAAVIIDGPYVGEKGPEGETVQKFTPRSRREMKTFEDIIRNAIGFDSSRGDQVTVSNVPFALEEEEGALFQGTPSWLEYAKKSGKPLFNLALVALFFFFALRPFRKWLNQAGEYAGTRALTSGEEVPRLAPEAAGPMLHQDDREQLLALTKNNPDAAADIIRSWMTEER